MNWSAIITTYNSGSVIGNALRSLNALPDREKPIDVVVVDNASSDNTVDIVKSFGHSVKIILNKNNLGLSKANNLGAGQASGESLFFINPDVELLPGAVTALHELQRKQPKAALIGPAMKDNNGNTQSTARTWPDPGVIVARRTSFGKTNRGRKICSDHLDRFNNADRSCPADWLVGAALWLTPAGRSKVGLMSESYFLYFEDVEWCWRAWKTGMEVWYEPGASVKHAYMRESASGGVTLGYHLTSMLRFMFTHPSLLFGKGPGVKK